MSKGEILSLVCVGLILITGLAIFIGQLGAEPGQPWRVLFLTFCGCNGFGCAYWHERQKRRRATSRLNSQN